MQPNPGTRACFSEPRPEIRRHSELKTAFHPSVAGDQIADEHPYQSFPYPRSSGFHQDFSHYDNKPTIHTNVTSPYEASYTRRKSWLNQHEPLPKLLVPEAPQPIHTTQLPHHSNSRKRKHSDDSKAHTSTSISTHIYQQHKVARSMPDTRLAPPSTSPSSTYYSSAYSRRLTPNTNYSASIARSTPPLARSTPPTSAAFGSENDNRENATRGLGIVDTAPAPLTGSGITTAGLGITMHDTSELSGVGGWTSGSYRHPAAVVPWF